MRDQTLLLTYILKHDRQPTTYKPFDNWWLQNFEYGDAIDELSKAYRTIEIIPETK